MSELAAGPAPAAGVTDPGGDEPADAATGPEGEQHSAVTAGFRAPFVPTRRLALAVLLLAPLWLLSGGPAGLAAAAGATALLALAAIVDALLSPGAHDLTVGRRAPAVLGLGDAAGGDYLVRSAWPRATRLELHDLPPDEVERRWGPPPERQDAIAGLGDHHQSAAAPIVDAPPSVVRRGPVRTVAAGGELRVPFTLVGRARGVAALGPVALRVEGPLGLVVRTLRYEPGDQVTVAPSVAGVRRYRLLALQHRLRDAGVRAVRRRGAGTSFAGLREYAVGDDPRHVDWKATARRGTMVTREFTVEQGQTVLVAIDAGRLMTQYAGALPRFEYALSSALVLAEVAAASGDEVGALVFDDEVRALVPPARGRLALQRLREALVPVRASMAEPDYAAAFRTLATRHRKRALLVLFTDVIDPRSSQALVAHATRGAARHLPLVVALRNDALLAAATPGAAASSGALYAAAAAEELLSARAEALARMRQAGASVVDVSPQAMTAAVVNRYLELKGRGAL